MTKAKKISFEESLTELEKIIQQLEQGDIPLEEALVTFQKGVKLSKDCQETLEKAEKTLTKIMTEENQEILFEGESEAQS